MKAHKLILSLFFCILSFSTIVQAKEQKIGIYVNDQPLSFADSGSPFIQQGTTMIPLRSVAEAFGLKVQWNQASQEITISQDGTEIKLTINQETVEVNGKEKTLQKPPMIIDDRTFVPLRFIGESLGKQVEWEPKGVNIFIADSKKKSDAYWLAKLVEAEAEDEPYEGKLAVAAVIINRTQSPFFPQSIKSVIFDPKQFTPVETNRIFRMNPQTDTIKAVTAALEGTDPTYGALYFFNPKKTDNPFLWSRKVTVNIGNHRFAI